MSDADYCYPPDFKVLKNKLNLRHATELERFETELVMQRVAEGVTGGSFDLAHLRAIHRHLFQDVYEWAGEIRAVEISKGGHQFQARRFIVTGMADVHSRLLQRNFLRGLDRKEFGRQAGHILGDVNYVHPFREGNGRTQLLYLEQLAELAGHRLDLTLIERRAWQAASREAHFGRYQAIGACIEGAILTAKS